MNRHHRLVLLLALAATATFSSAASAANIWLSLNLEFNSSGDSNSGGTWTAVAKADPQGLAGASLYLTNANFGSFLAPPELDIQLQSTFGTVRNVVVGDDLQPPLPLGIGVIGSSFPSSYVDPAGLVPIMGYPDLGSFTGGVALATGTFDPGVLPDWAMFGGNSTGANLFSGPNPPAVAADVLLTVRAVPEPATLCLLGMAVLGIVASARKSG